ncbi:MAG: hypothetical protein ACTH4U_12280 [Pseudoalteromonas prydzensis]|uniref:hypothetical protein n=1 Tax=Pseudoalteromonas prydzensis TaxID=182141 RepID=UPI003F9C8460
MSNLKIFISIFIVLSVALFFTNKLRTKPANLNGVEHIVKEETFSYNLDIAMENHKKKQDEKLNKLRDVYIESLKNKYGEEKFNELLGVCDLFTNLYVNNRTKENELKYIEACDPSYH